LKADETLFDVHEREGLRLIIPARSGAVGNAPGIRIQSNFALELRP